MNGIRILLSWPGTWRIRITLRRHLKTRKVYYRLQGVHRVMQLTDRNAIFEVIKALYYLQT